MSKDIQSKPFPFGIGSMAVAAIALLIAVAHISFGPFEPQKPVEESIAETAVKIKDAAKRAISGEPAPVQEQSVRRPINIDQVIEYGVFALAGAAIILSIISLIKREDTMPAYLGFSLGAGVLLLSWLQWIALIICGVIILAAIISNLDQILS